MSIFDLANQQNSSMGTSDGIGALASNNSIYPQSRMDKTQYATPSQLPTSADVISSDYDPKTDAFTGMPNQHFRRGGIAALRYDDGGDVQQQAPAYTNDDKGNLVDSSGKVVATAEARNDPYISSVASDPTEAQSLFDLKTKDPKQFYSQVADKLGSSIIGKYQTNDNYDTEYNQLQSIKNIDPAAYYRNQLGFKAHSMGWQVGQNTGDRNAPTQQEIQSIIPEAQKAGLSTDQINSIISQNFTQARDQNVQRIANLAETGGSGFSFQKDVQPMWPVLAAALTAGAAGAYAGGAGAAEAGTAGVGAADAAGAGSNVFSGLSATGSAAGTAGSQLTAAEIAALQAAPATTAGTAGITALEAAAPTTNTGITALEAANAIPNGSLTEAQLAKLAATQATEDAAAVAGTGPAPAGSGILGNTYGATPWITASNAAKAALALKLLGSSAGSSGGGGGGTQVSTQSATPTTTTTSIPFNPGTSTVFHPTTTTAMPTMGSYNPSTGLAYQPLTYRYAAQGGLMYADGGIADLGGYAAGGKLLKGPGDGMSDSIVANIGGKQPARLADGEFVIPADVVSHLGNGSTDAGAKHLYKMMDQIRKARTGNPKQGKQINADKFLPRN